jgi:hypothetical protein
MFALRRLSFSPGALPCHHAHVHVHVHVHVHARLPSDPARSANEAYSAASFLPSHEQSPRGAPLNLLLRSSLAPRLPAPPSLVTTTTAAMFWRFGGYAQLSSLDSILDKPDVTVEELLDESDLIQELKQQNSKLIEYLRDENVLERLLRYVTAPKPLEQTGEGQSGGGLSEIGSPTRQGFFGKVAGRARSTSTAKSDAGEGEENKEERTRMKYAYVSCEILSSEVWSISEAVLENQESLKQFWAYIKQPAPLDPVQAGYFTKVNESLLDRKMEEMLDFFKSLDNVVTDMLQHVDCPVIMDLLLKIISLEKSEGGQGIVDVSPNILLISLSVADQTQVATTARPCTPLDRLPWTGPLHIDTDIRWRLSESNHNNISQCNHAGSVRDRAQ